MALHMKDLIAAQEKLAASDKQKQGEPERMSIADFKKMMGMNQDSSKKQVELLTKIESLNVQSNSVQQDTAEQTKAIVEKDDGTHSRLDDIKATLQKGLVETKNQTKTLEKLEKASEVKPSMESTVEAERDRAEQLKLLKKIADKDDKGKTEEKKKTEGSGLGGLATAIAIALGGIVGAISGYVKAIVKMNKLLFSAIESAIVGLGKFFPSLKKMLFNIEVTFVLGLEMIKEAFGNFIKKALKVFDGVKDFIGGILGKLMNSDVMKTIVSTFTKVIEGVKSFFAPISDAFKVMEETSTPIRKAIGWVMGHIKTFGEFFSEIGTKLSMFSKLFKAVAVVAEKIAFPLTVIMTIWDVVKGAIEGFKKEGIVGAISGAIKGLISSLITAPLDMLKDAVSWILDIFGFDSASKFLDSFNFDDMMKAYVDAIFHPIDTIKAMFNGILDFFDKLEIPEIGFTIPIIDKKVSIGPFRPFKGASATPTAPTSAGGATAQPAAKVADGAGAKSPAPATGSPDASKATPAAQAETATKISKPNGDTRLAAPSAAPDTTVNVAVSTPKTADRVQSDSYKKAYTEAIAAGKTPQQAETLALKASQAASPAAAAAPQTAAPSAPVPTEANAVYNKSAENAGAAQQGPAAAPVIVNAPSTVNNTSKQNISLPAPTRNEDSGYNRYIGRNVVFV